MFSDVIRNRSDSYTTHRDGVVKHGDAACSSGTSASVDPRQVDQVQFLLSLVLRNMDTIDMVQIIGCEIPPFSLSLSLILTNIDKIDMGKSFPKCRKEANTDNKMQPYNCSKCAIRTHQFDYEEHDVGVCSVDSAHWVLKKT